MTDIPPTPPAPVDGNDDRERQLRELAGSLRASSVREREALERAARAEAAAARTEELLAQECARTREMAWATDAHAAVMSIVSHEMRSPLSAMIMWVDVLRSEQLSAQETRKALDRIERGIKTQTKLIEDVVDLWRVLAGTVCLEFTLADPATLVETVVAEQRAVAEEKRVHIGCDVDPAAGPLRADAARVRQILSNLLANAIKFTPAGGRVDVRVTCDASQIAFTVADTGQGIAADAFPRLFQRFRHPETAGSHARVGCGLGLPVVRSLVGLHGGTVVAESGGSGRGATFTVKLPLEPAPR